LRSAIPFLFAADLDGTLLPNTGKPPAPGCLERTRRLLSELRKNGVPICFVTGRFLSRAKSGISTFRLPCPTWWVCNVGTEIYDARGEPDLAWERAMGPEIDAQRLRQAVSRIPRLSVQEPEKQGRHKFSFYYPEPASVQLQAELLRHTNAIAEGLQLMVSAEESSGRALLDFIPAKAGKKPALEYLAQAQGLANERVFFAGDSGNDLDVIPSGVCVTLVGNAPDEVRLDARALQSGSARAQLYLARSRFGDGIAEGLRHYGFWPFELA
jgi:sucrose-6-phosphatase